MTNGGVTAGETGPWGHSLPVPGSGPLVIEVWRGNLVESRHRVACAVADADGGAVASWGDVARPVYPRSASKPIQALPLLETGAADAFGLAVAELALSCASHYGEQRHAEAVGRWLSRVGLSAADLECGTHWPYNEAAAYALARAGQEPSALHNNCSGKHAGMLTTARHLGEPTAGYVRAEHPVQRRVAATLEAMCGSPLASAPCGIDGCSIPTLAVPLAALARGMARFVAPGGLPPVRAAACQRLAAAMAAEPLMVSGTGRFNSELLAAGEGRIIAKSGAEGVYMAGIPGKGLGIALKVADGAARAAEVALLGLLDHLGVLDDGQRARLTPLAEPKLLNRRGLETGCIRLARSPSS